MSNTASKVVVPAESLEFLEPELQRANVVITDGSSKLEKENPATTTSSSDPNRLIGDLANEERQCSVVNPAMKPGEKGLMASRFATAEEKKMLRF